MKCLMLLLVIAITGCSSYEYKVFDNSTKIPLSEAMVLMYTRGDSEVCACVSDKEGKFLVDSKPDILLVGKEGYAIKMLGKYSPREIYLDDINTSLEKSKFRKKHSELFVNFDDNPILLPTFLLNKLPKNSQYCERWNLYSQYLKSQISPLPEK